MKSGTLVGHRVLALDGGSDLGRVRQIIFNTSNARAAALLLEDKDLFGLLDAQVVVWEQIREIGEDAVMVQDARALQKAGGIPGMTALLERKHLMPGAKLYTEGGTGLGNISDVLFNREGAIESYELSSGLIEDALRGKRYLPATHPLRLGEEVAFVESSAAEDLRTTMPELKSTLHTMRQQVSESLSPDSLTRTTQQLQKSLNDAAEKFKDTWQSEGSAKSPPDDKQIP